MIVKLIENSPGITLSYSAWIPLLCAGIALAIAFSLVRRADFSQQRRFGGYLGVLFLTLAALYFGSYKASFNSTGASLYAFGRYDLKVDWQDVRGVRLERAHNRGRVGHVLMIATASGELEFNISDLNDDGLGRLMPYVEAQVGASRALESHQ